MEEEGKKSLCWVPDCGRPYPEEEEENPQHTEDSTPFSLSLVLSLSPVASAGARRVMARVLSHCLGDTRSSLRGPRSS